jgi:hypothetical protein
LINELTSLCILDPQELRDKIDASGSDWYIPVCEASVEEAERILLSTRAGWWSPYEARFYHQGTGFTGGGLYPVHL